MSISLFSPIYLANDLNICENCSSLRFTTHFFNFGQKAHKIQSIHSKIEVFEENDTKPSWFGIAARVAAFFTIILPLIMMIGLLIYRAANTFELHKDAGKSPTRINLEKKISENREIGFDEFFVSKNKMTIIPGYLNLGINEGWEEGGNPQYGFIFTRLAFVKYIAEQKDLGINEPIFEKVIDAFPHSGCTGNIHSQDFVEESHRPKKTRACYDSAFFGWEMHAVTRMVGNLASVYGPSKPFFEILINSARISIDSPLCKPFFISIYSNQKELDERRKVLVSLKNAQPEIAVQFYYHTNLKKPKEFLEENQDRLGPNSTRIIIGLEFLQDRMISSQITGNCWMKQPIRCLLVSLYLELLSYRQNLNPEEAWKEAESIYKDIQKTVAIPLMEKYVNETEMSLQMKKNALRAIERQRKITSPKFI